jgi:hypothetical protein
VGEREKQALPLSVCGREGRKEGRKRTSWRWTRKSRSRTCPRSRPAIPGHAPACARAGWCGERELRGSSRAIARRCGRAFIFPAAPRSSWPKSARGRGAHLEFRLRLVQQRQDAAGAADHGRGHLGAELRPKTNTNHTRRLKSWPPPSNEREMFGTLRKHTNNPNPATHVRPRGHNAPSDTARHADAATRAPRDTPPLLLAEAGALVAFTERDRETKDAQRAARRR